MITPDVVELRERFNLPGMRILQFAFGEDETHYFLPHHYVPNSVAYTGTHDNDTSVGWWSSATPGEKGFARKYLGSDGKRIHWDMIRAISSSEANTVIILMQDVLGLSGDHRMNLPGHHAGNWEWRFSWDQIRPQHAQALAKIAAEYGRGPHNNKHYAYHVRRKPAITSGTAPAISLDLNLLCLSKLRQKIAVQYFRHAIRSKLRPLQKTLHFYVIFLAIRYAPHHLSQFFDSPITLL